MVRTRLNIGCRYSTPVRERPLHPTRGHFTPEPSQTQAPVTPATEPERRAGGSLTTLGFVPLSKTGAELLFELISQRYERGATLITSNLPFDEWTGTFGTERLTGALLDRITHHVHILDTNGT